MAATVAMAKVEMLNLAPVSSVGSPKMEICLAFLDFFQLADQYCGWSCEQTDCSVWTAGEGGKWACMQAEAVEAVNIRDVA